MDPRWISWSFLKMWNGEDDGIETEYYIEFTLNKQFPASQRLFAD